MPLVPQQDVIVISTLGGGPNVAVEKLKEALESYPPCRIVSIAFKQSGVAAGTDLVAVIETVGAGESTTSARQQAARPDTAQQTRAAALKKLHAPLR